MSLLRLLHLQEQNDAKGEYFKIVRNKYLNQDKPEIITAFNLFQTPSAIAHQMVELLPDLEGKIILEPSAGLGRLIAEIPKRHHKNIIACDVEPKCAGYLYENFPDLKLLKQGDFLQMNFKADIVIMNPPFKQGLDIKHINHAANMLNPGGVLVALCYDGVRQNRELRSIADSWQVLPKDSFKAEGTKAGVVMLTIQK